MTPVADSAEKKRNAWLNPKSIRFWCVILILVYTLCGFFALPAVIDSQIRSFAQEKLGRDATIGQVRVNPYVLSLQVDDFALLDRDNTKLFAFDQYFVNFQLSSLFRWAWTFREIRLDGGYLFFERFALDDTRLSRLLDDIATNSQAEDAGNEEESALPRLLIQELSLSDGNFAFRDQVPRSTVDLELGPIDVSIQELNSLPDRYGQQSVNIRFPGDALLGWQGSISLAPLDSEGELVIENSNLDKTIAYLEATLPLQDMGALLSARTRYRLQARPDGDLGIELDGLEAELEEVRVSGLSPSTEFLRIPSLAIKGGSLRYPENEFKLQSVTVSGPELVAWLDENGEPSLAQLDTSGAQQSSTANGDETPWDIEIDEFRIQQGRLQVSDRGFIPAGEVDLHDLGLVLTGINNQDGSSMPLELSGNPGSGGAFDFKGELVLLPELSLNGAANLDDIALATGQPWVQQQFRLIIDGGLLDSRSEIRINPAGEITASGSIEVNDLSVQDSIENKDLVGWNSLEIDRYEWQSSDPSLRLSSVLFDQPHGRIVINEDLSTNLAALVVAPETAPDSTAEQAQEPISLLVGGIGVNEGRLDFSDLSLPLPFATRISALEGTISTIDTDSAEPATVRMEGQVDDYGLARIEGTMAVFDPIRHTDITMEFRNLLMSRLSPYSIQFAGREIDEGKLDLDLGYFIDNGQLKGSNQIVLSDLELGAEVDHPDAMSLPLGLAVALLKDSEGVIDIELPVEGDVNDPEFKIGGVVMQAIVGLITKVVTAPFRLLGNLIGVDSEDFGQFQFLAGRSDLTPPELEKIAQLQQALMQRPELGIQVNGVCNPVIDTPRLQYFRLRQQVVDRLGQEPGSEDSDFEMLDEEIRSVLESIYTERFPDSTPEILKSAHRVPPPDDAEGEPVLDELAYAADLRDRLLSAQDISADDLTRLANDRAGAIRDAFLATGEFDAERIVIGEAEVAESEDGEWVMMELGVAAE